MVDAVITDSYSLLQEIDFHKEDQDLLLHTSDRELVFILMKYGKNSLGVSSLHLAFICQDTHAIERLIKAGAKVTEEILQVANKSGNIEMLYLLQETHPSPHEYRFSVTKSESILKTAYLLKLDEGDFYITKGRFGGSYELRNNSLNTEAIGRVRIGSRGQEPTWDSCVDLYDLNNIHLGVVIGESMNTKDAMVSFYDGSGEKVAFAYYEEAHQEILLVASNNYAKVIAKIIHDSGDWKVSVYQGQDIDLRAMQLLLILAIEALKP